MIQFMFNDEGVGWGMRKPNLILSITKCFFKKEKKTF
jgi:hypothetical protein